MHKLIVGLLGATAFAAASAASAQVTTFGTPSGTLGTTQGYSTARGTVTLSGFNGSTAVDLFGKNNGGDEVGVGLNGDPNGQHEINALPSWFVQADLSGLSANTTVAFLLNSVTAGEGWAIYGTNTADCYKCGTALTGSTEGWQAIGVPSFRYYDFFATGTSNNAPSNVLLGGIDVGAAVPEPATWAMMLIGFGGIGFAARRSRRKVALAQLA